MNCEEVSLLFEEFYDGELDSHSKSRIEKHLAICLSCSADFDKVARLDQLLGKSAMPPQPSTILDRKLMAAFQNQYQKPLKSPAWWERIFVGSVSIPKPAFAVVFLMIAVALAAIVLIDGRRGISTAPSASLPVSLAVAPQPLPPEIIEKTKIVEVPVVKERVVTRVVYLNRAGSEAVKSQKSLPVQIGGAGNRRNQFPNKDNTNLAKNNSAEKGEYVTLANLTGFQQMPELKMRIIPESKANEK